MKLPQTYNETKIILMVRDPYWIYAYWEMSGFKIRENERLFLKINNITEGLINFLSIDYNANNWYIEVGKPGTTFNVELGIVLEDSTFTVLSTSNYVRTPYDSVSCDGRVEYDSLKRKDEIYSKIIKDLEFGISTPGSRFIR